MILAGKTAFFLHFAFNPHYYPVAAFYSYTTEGQGWRAVFQTNVFFVFFFSTKTETSFLRFSPSLSNTMRLCHQ